ncbi:hypothetical protein OESDEN_22977 [Oesophagostomum dentatum]|uniref:Uncharacterized protein n=1 Tax=Oesophagostomum dentatum TaxID=61180 RepID=A0A0B1RWF1_OESDE|nr:hypothetical protein OESDEN_22977 [Oesophagostomum dentatum]
MTAQLKAGFVFHNTFVSAHITHGFVSNEGNLSPKERCIDSMEKLAWPVVHGSMSTILGVTVLAFINSYMVLVFFKTIFLVLIIGRRWCFPRLGSSAHRPCHHDPLRGEVQRPSLSDDRGRRGRKPPSRRAASTPSHCQSTSPDTFFA